MTCRAKCSHARRDSATQNNGQITQFRDGVSGEQVSYGYDSLNRLISASASSGAWGQSFTYDGFGNLLQKTVTQGSAPTLSVAVDSATNRMVGQSYDANGNLLYNGAVYDALNRVWQIYQYGSLNTEGYAYGPNNERVEKVITANGVSNYYTYLYGVDGCRLGVYQPAIDGTGRLYFQGGSAITPCFGGRMLSTKAGQLAVADRLGSIRPLNGSQTATTSYYPYGEEQPQQSTEDTERFATYYRDSTNLDYAVNRYYSSQFGRFLTPDPSASGDPADPESWNFYTYVANDPVNVLDPEGLEKCKDIGVVGSPNKTVNDLLDMGTALGIVATTIFTESAMNSDANDRNEMAAIAAVIITRYNIVNGVVSMIRSDGTFQQAPQAWGAADNTIRSLVINPGQFEVWQGADGTLSDAAQSRLAEALTKDADSDLCAALLNAIGTANLNLAFKNKPVLLVDDKTGLAYTGFNSFEYINKYDWEREIGQYGSANRFYGIPAL